MRAHSHPERELAATYETFLQKMTIEQRHVFWMTIFTHIIPILHAFQDDPLLIPGLERVLAWKLGENDLKPRPLRL